MEDQVKLHCQQKLQRKGKFLPSASNDSNLPFRFNDVNPEGYNQHLHHCDNLKAQLETKDVSHA
jgi:hypothetical protein